MGDVKKLLDSLLLSLYGRSKLKLLKRSSKEQNLRRLGSIELKQIEEALRRHMIKTSEILINELISRDRYRRSQELLCGYVDAILHFLADNNHPPMRFSLNPPPVKSPHIITSPTNSKNNNNSSSSHNDTRRLNSKTTAKYNSKKTVRINLNNNMQAKPIDSDQYDRHHQHQHQHRSNLIPSNIVEMAGDKVSSTTSSTASEIQDDYNQWLHAMKLVARLPGGMPPEFRRKLWLTLAEKYMKSRNVDWEKEEKKCLSEEWREDDEELGIQIVKDLHRTGSNLCSGPAAKINQARLKRVLLGYARYNPEVGYCQGFNMLGALILQVMDKEEIESMKVMIYLVEGILPPGYFCGSMGGLQADMSVFRELMQLKLPRLAKHLEKLQGPVENAYEPPLTNVFTMQWFLTMFCTCLPMTCVLRVWDLVLIEGSDVLLRTALVLWSLLEERVLGTRSADDFYCKMGSFASELLNGHLIDSNSLIEKVVQLGPITDIQKLRNKHLYNITPIRHKSNLPLYIGDEEPENDEASRLAIATVWGIPWTRRGSQSASSAKPVPITESKDRLALDISLLKKQYDKLRERQKQAHIIITTACSTARQGSTSNVSPSITPVNQLLMGRSAIITNQGRRIAPPTGVIPPARKPSLPTILQSKPAQKQLRRGETLHWRDTDLTKRRRDSLTWKEIKADRMNQPKDESHVGVQTQKLHCRIGKSDSSSYSEESEDNDDDGSSTDTSLCDDDPTSAGDKTHSSSIENSPKRRLKVPRRSKGPEGKHSTSKNLTSKEPYTERCRPKSWAPSASEIPFMLLTSDSPVHQRDIPTAYKDEIKEEEDERIEKAEAVNERQFNRREWVVPSVGYSPIAGDLATSATTLEPLNIQANIIDLPIVTSISQLSPMPDITSFLRDATISPLPTPKPSLLDSTNSLGSCDGDEAKKFDVSDDGVTNQYFERVNSIERPSKLDLFYSLNGENGSRRAFDAEDEDVGIAFIKKSSIESTSFFYNNHRPDLLINHPQNLNSDSCDLEAISGNDEIKDRLLLLGERDDNIPGENLDDYREENVVETREDVFKPHSKSTNSYLNRASQKRRDPRRLTLTRSTTMEIEERFQALEKHFSHDISTLTYKTEDISSGYETTNPDMHEGPAEEHISNLDERSNFTNSIHDALRTYVEDDNLLCSTRPEIPSTTDLEERFERQMSASSKPDRDSIELRRSSMKNDRDEGNRKEESQKENIKHQNSSRQSTKPADIEAEKDIKSEENNESKKTKSSPKRMPSTAELEERFDALEIKVKAENSGASKSKKEPPDIDEVPKRSDGNTDVRRSRKINQEVDSELESTKKKIPPSTAELEKRFHALEKQMSTSAEKTETSKSMKNDQPEHDQDVQSSKKINQPKNEHETNKAELREKTAERRASEPPSTEDLERRYESLKRRMSTRIVSHSETIDEALQRIEKSVISEDPDGSSKTEKETKIKYNSPKDRSPIQRKNMKEEGEQQVPEPPPLPPHNDVERHVPKVGASKERQALIEELQSKIEMHSHDETLKPSSINPNRKLPPSHSSKSLEQPSLRYDVTSETHALTAFLQSENYEPWQGYTPKMVRRFSDLPSRADLENRLEFLEQKFYRKLLKQRCASDSEVASRKRFVNITKQQTNDAEPSSSGLGSSAGLEQRLQALEKQLSENSLKLLEAMRSKVHEDSVETDLLRKVSTETIDASGKELVRYTHFGELDESGVVKPINISINIKMMVDKKTEKLESERTSMATIDLERRLEALELQLKASRMPNTNNNESDPGNPIVFEKDEGSNESMSNSKIDAQALESLEVSRLHKSKEIGETPKCDPKEQTQTIQEENMSKRKFSKSDLNISDDVVTPREVTESKNMDLKKQAQKEIPENEEFSKPADNSKVEMDKEESRKLTSKDQDSVQQEECLSNKSSKSKSESKLDIGNKETKKAQNIEVEKKDGLEMKMCSKCSPYQKEGNNDTKDIQKDIQNEASHKPKSTEKIDEKIVEGKCPASEPSQRVEISKPDQIIQGEKICSKLKVDENREPAEDPEKSKTCHKLSSEVECKKDKKETQKSEKTKLECIATKDNEHLRESLPTPLAEKLVINASEIGTVDANKKTLVLLLDNEPKSVKVRRLTRANTEELEGLFQALEKQLQDRNLVKSDDGTLRHAENKDNIESNKSTKETKAISELTKEIEEFTTGEITESIKETVKEEEKPYDWGPDPVKRHLKRKTVHLPSTKELEARFRSLERQIKLLEDVEKIDVEQRLHEIERKIKLQYSLAHEKDLTKYLELCEGKGLDDEASYTPSSSTKEDDQVRCECGRRTPSKVSPGSATIRKSSQSPSRKPITPSTPPAQSSRPQDRSSRSKAAEQKKQPIHPLEMLLDPSPDDSKIPSTGELEHRIRILDEKLKTPPTSSRKSRSRSPVSKRRTPSKKGSSKKPLHKYPTYISPTKPEPPTAEELEARMRALEEDHIFDPKTQRNFKEFNEKLKNVISPSVSFEECRFESTRDIRDISPRHNTDPYRSPTSRSDLRYTDTDIFQPRSTSPKVLRFSEDDDYTNTLRSYREPIDHQRPVGTSYEVLNTIEENSKILHRILEKTFAEPKDERSSGYGTTLASLASEGLDAMGSRLMRETSPLRRTGTVTGVPLRTYDNINERLTSIKDSIKSIDTLCEEKPYRKEKCQRYIDSLFSDSLHFAEKKASLEDLRTGRTRHTEYTPSIQVSDLSHRPTDNYLSRSTGSAESIRTKSPLRAASPLHHRSNRDLSRNADISPSRRGRRYDEDRDEYESRVRRSNMPNFILDNHSNLSRNDSSLTKFYKVDSQLESNERDNLRSDTESRSPVRSPYELTLHNTSTSPSISTNYSALTTQNKNVDLDKSISPYRQTTHSNIHSLEHVNRSNPPVYNPGKLEIRHTTFTSTFYDRVLNEKKLEKSLSRPSSHSPGHAVPTHGDKNYMGTSIKAMTSTSSNSLKNPSNFNSSLSSSTSTLHNPVQIQTTLHYTNNKMTTNPNTTLTGNSNSYRFSQKLLSSSSRIGATIHNDLRLRRCDNKIMKFHSTSNTTATSTSTTTTTLPSMMPISTTSTLSFLNNTNQTTTAATTTSTYSINSISESTPIGPTSNLTYLNLLNSSNLGSSATNFKSLLPFTTDMPSSTPIPIASSTGSTVPFIANSSVLSLGSYTSTTTTGASYSFMSTLQTSTVNSNMSDHYSIPPIKNLNDIG